jgi:hypothetical protein
MTTDNLVFGFIALVFSVVLALGAHECSRLASQATARDAEIYGMGCFQDGGLVYCPGHVCQADSYLDPKKRRCVPFVSPRTCPLAEGETR